VAFPWNRARRGNEDETETAEKFAPVGEAVRAALTGPWIAGDDFSVSDILIVSILRNTVELGLLEPGDPVTAYVERGLARPAQLRADAASTKSA
jgi:glutathione S-transferase